MLKIITLYCLCLIILVSMVSCNDKKIKIGLLFSLINERTKIQIDCITAKVTELKGEVMVASAELDDQRQIKQAKDMIAKNVKVLVVSPANLYTAAAIVREAHKHKVLVIAFDRLIRNCDLDYYVSFDYEKIGDIIAKYAIDHKPQGTYIMINGDKTDQNARGINKGELRVLEPLIALGKIKVVYSTFVEDWSDANAKSKINKFIDLSCEDTPDAILSSSDLMSSGILDALNEHNLLGKVLLTGMDAKLKNCKNIIKGYQTMTVYKPIIKLAYKTAELAMALASNNKINETTTTMWNGEKNVTSILFAPVMVDKNNIKTTLIADGIYNEEALYEK